MKLHHTIIIAAAVIVAGAIANAAMVKTDANESARLARAPFYASGLWTALNPDTSTAASTSALTANSRYVLQCTTDTYLRFGTAASSQDATSSTGYLPAGAWLEFSVEAGVQFLSALSKGSDGICYLVEAK